MDRTAPSADGGRGVVAPAMVALSLVGATAVLAPTASAQVPDPGTTPVVVTATPSEDLQHGQVVTLSVTGAVPSTTLGTAVCDATAPLTLDRCDLDTLVLVHTDGAGGAVVARAVSRYIVTSSGVHDCATDACVLGVGTLELVAIGSVPITFAADPAPSSGLALALDGPVHLSQDPTGPATVPATLACDAPGTVRIDFRLSQAPTAGGAANRATSVINVPCEPGTPIDVTSDLLGAFEPGAAEVLVRATAGAAHATATGDVTVASAAAAVAALQARLADPEDTTVVADFWAVLTFRLQYNPVFARAFWRAVLAASG